MERRQSQRHIDQGTVFSFVFLFFLAAQMIFFDWTIHPFILFCLLSPRKEVGNGEMEMRLKIERLLIIDQKSFFVL
jgi:hypothetical protein